MACPEYWVLGGSASASDVAPAEAAGVATLVAVNAVWVGSAGAFDAAAGRLVLAFGLPSQPESHTDSIATPRPADAAARNLRTIDLDGRPADAIEDSVRSVHRSSPRSAKRRQPSESGASPLLFGRRSERRKASNGQRLVKRA